MAKSATPAADPNVASVQFDTSGAIVFFLGTDGLADDLSTKDVYVTGGVLGYKAAHIDGQAEIVDPTTGECRYYPTREDTDLAGYTPTYRTALGLDVWRILLQAKVVDKSDPTKVLTYPSGLDANGKLIDPAFIWDVPRSLVSEPHPDATMPAGDTVVNAATLDTAGAALSGIPKGARVFALRAGDSVAETTATGDDVWALTLESGSIYSIYAYKPGWGPFDKAVSI